MKAIHNYTLKKKIIIYTVFNTSKIQNESNSQHFGKWKVMQLYCVQYVNPDSYREQNESNSQHVL